MLMLILRFIYLSELKTQLHVLYLRGSNV